jgi:drug/metabolite transporter (DMT)-like permease
MDAVTFSAVIAAAAMHAGWNAFVKLKIDPLLGMTLITTSCGLIAAAFLPFTGLPQASAWPWLVASVVLHLGSYIALTEAYRRAEMSQVYPLARGGAPMLTVAVGFLLFGERLTVIQTSAVVALGLGIMTISLAGRRAARGTDWSVPAFAALTAAMICGYTLVDGLGARVAADPHAYSAALFTFETVPLFSYVLWRRGRAALDEMRGFAWQGAAGGALALGSYWIAIWAMTRAPIPLVAATRESSVLFAAAIAHLWLRERLVWPRVIACVIIVAGLVVLRAG